MRSNSTHDDRRPVKAVLIDRFGRPDELQSGDAPVPGIGHSYARSGHDRPATRFSMTERHAIDDVVIGYNFRREMMSVVGVVFKFRIDPENNDKMDMILQENFGAVAAEEYPSGDVKTYTVYRDKSIPGQWWMFKLFTEKVPADHAAGPPIYEPARALQALMLEPFERMLLDPVIIHGCGERIPGVAPLPKRDEKTDVGVIYTFKVAPENDEKIEQIMRDIFDAMAEEEYPTGEVISYTLFRDPSEVGKWAMFEHFTAEGSAVHATGPKIFKIGTEQLTYLVEPYCRVELDPVIVHGCGKPVPGSPAV
jgi:quinol monooxygenase YgiN